MSCLVNGLFVVLSKSAMLMGVLSFLLLNLCCMSS